MFGKTSHMIYSRVVWNQCYEIYSREAEGSCYPLRARRAKYRPILAASKNITIVVNR